MSHVTHMNESCRTHEWVMSHTWMSHFPMYECFIWHTCKVLLTYQWVMSHSHVTHIGMSHVTHIWMSHVTHIRVSHFIHKRVMSHKHEWVKSHTWGMCCTRISETLTTYFSCFQSSFISAPPPADNTAPEIERPCRYLSDSIDAVRCEIEIRGSIDPCADRMGDVERRTCVCVCVCVWCGNVGTQAESLREDSFICATWRIKPFDSLRR